ncbi:MAG: radical SAM protein [Candidatus Wallbacteria bacterium]|nr:radical SAM protein [Candidatus Wallbacteria bacterium]
MLPTDQIISALVDSLRQNTVPITSRCQADCFFCSNKFNPPGVSVYSFDFTVEILKQYFQLLSSDSPIIIGESATRICEGEPLLHPDLKKILSSLRELYPETPIKLTTNGVLLDRDWLDFFIKIKPFELTVSVNSIGRHYEFMKCELLLPLPFITEFLSSNSVPLNISLVYFRQFETDLFRDLESLKKLPAQLWRILKPGRSKLADFNADWPEKSFYKKLDPFREDRLILLEPPELSDLEARVLGFTRVFKSGLLKAGDVILEVSGIPVKSRYEAFLTLTSLKDPTIRFQRNGQLYEMTIRKERKEKSGLVFEHDIHPDDWNSVSGILASNFRIVSAPLPASFLKSIFPEKRELIISCPNTVFGGNICVAGLMTLQDLTKLGLSGKYYLPSVMFNNLGFDLTGQTIKSGGFDVRHKAFYLEL